MGRNDNESLAWLALLARLNAKDMPPGGGNSTAARLNLDQVVAIAGRLLDYDAHAANDLDAEGLIWLLVGCAKYLATLAPRRRSAVQLSR